MTWYFLVARFGRKTVQAGITAMFAGLALLLLVVHRPGPWNTSRSD